MPFEQVNGVNAVFLRKQYSIFKSPRRPQQIRLFCFENTVFTLFTLWRNNESMTVAPVFLPPLFFCADVKAGQQDTYREPGGIV
jgi:hypothetical protein